MKVCPVCATEYGDDIRFCKNDGSALRAFAAATDLVGQIIADRYHIIRKLGEGGMGQVYLAEHVKMGRRSAIKVMNAAMVHDPDMVARFNREAANASRISHANVCAVYDFGETPDGLVYLVMEFVEGEPLTELLEREGAVSLERGAHIFFQVAGALQAAHDLGIVHRDLKPDNIMITRDREGLPAVKVVDFGIAKAVGSGAGDNQKVTRTGLVIGTPEFMSPEQLAGDAVDGRSDLYALGLVLFRMLTGKLPFAADTIQETMVQRLTEPPLTLAAARPDLRFPDGLQACFDSALARTPTDRYQSVSQLARAVMALAPRVPSTGHSLDASTQMLDAGATGVTGRRSTPQTRASTPAPTPAPTPSPRSRRLAPAVLGLLAVLAAAGGAVALLGGNDTPPLQTTEVTVADTVERRAAAAGRPAPRVELDPRAAGALLDRLIEAPWSVVLDSALLVYRTPAVDARNRAFAACLLARGYRDRGVPRTALAWADSGLLLDDGLNSCRSVVQELRRDGGA